MTVTSMNDKLERQLTDCLNETHLPYPKRQGKARDIYELNDYLLIIATDRISGFDRTLTTIPFKGQVLNQLSVWWFHMTKHIIPNHLITVPDPYSMIVQKCQPIPIEVVVRGYLTGSTQTSIWTLYKKGHRQFFGQKLPEGMKKDDPLPQPILTPTTKETSHDRPLELEEIPQKTGITEKQWDKISQTALKLFDFGQKIALQHGLVLVDTKYEFGWDQSGQLCIIDELHTPDSSRFWQQSHKSEHYDKEILRQWYKDHSSPYTQSVLPEAPNALRIKMAKRYIKLYEQLTGERFNGQKFNTQQVMQEINY